MITLLSLLVVTASISNVQVNKIIIDDDEIIIASRDTVLIIKLEYVHSVELTSIVETYMMRDCEITLVNFTWSGAGAGLPTLSDFPNHTKRTEEGYSLENVSLPTKVIISMKYRLNPKLTIDGKEVVARDSVIIEACSYESLTNIVQYKLLKALKS